MFKYYSLTLLIIAVVNCQIKNNFYNENCTKPNYICENLKNFNECGIAMNYRKVCENVITINNLHECELDKDNYDRFCSNDFKVEQCKRTSFCEAYKDFQENSAKFQKYIDQHSSIHDGAIKIDVNKKH
ncbi:hypothetical protein HCN44_002300 [Aphidius gifuensis]|uniref:Odorant-binding protein n=1 Tax=Aphidius gifuensis TaxID=684658 RepID=A0A834Y3V1_APHGI|nr:hypothetical protein HCN44_002300 [Aphidius gifuensis]